MRSSNNPALARNVKLGAAMLAAFGLIAFAAWQADGRITEKRASVTVPANTTGEGSEVSVEARCPKGKRVVLGGFEVPTVPDNTPTHLMRDGKRRWQAGVVNYDGDEPTTLTSIGYCSELKKLKTRTETTVIPAQGGDDEPETVAAKCRRKERLAFGGFELERTTDNDPYLSELRRIGKRRWQAGAFNFTGTTELTSIAYCSKKAPKTKEKSETEVVDGDEEAQLEAKCGQRKRLSFGGYQADVTNSDAFILLRALERSGGRAWQVSVRNDNSLDAGTLTAYAYCKKKRK